MARFLRCNKCQEVLLVTDFGPSKRHKSGRRPTCNICWAAYMRGTRQGRNEVVVSAKEYRRLLEIQGGACAICQRPQAARLLAVDHDHDSGQVRGLLCSGCNRGLGMFGESPETLRRAASYLELSEAFDPQPI